MWCLKVLPSGNWKGPKLLTICTGNQGLANESGPKFRTIMGKSELENADHETVSDDLALSPLCLANSA